MRKNGAHVPNATGRARPTHSSFSPQYAALTAVLLTCTLENQISAPDSYLLTDFSAMTGFRPDGLRRFGTVLCAQLRSSGFPFLLRQSLPSGMPRLLYIGWQYEIVRQLTLEKAKSCAFPPATIHDMGVICKRFEKNMPHLFQSLEKSRSLCQNKKTAAAAFQQDTG